MSRASHDEKQVRTTAVGFGVYAVSTADEFVLCDASGGVCTPTLPTITDAMLGLAWSFQKADATGNLVSVTATGGDQIDGAGSYDLNTQWQGVTLLAKRNALGVASWSVQATNSTGGSGTPSAGTFISYSNRLWVM